MLRLTAMLRRNPSLTHDQFVAHWRSVHAPLMARPSIARHIVRYEQHAVAPDLPDWVGTAGFDGVAVQWFADLDAFTAFLAEPDYRDHIAPDEARLLDVGATQWLVTEAPVVVIEGQVPSSVGVDGIGVDGRGADGGDPARAGGGAVGDPSTGAVVDVQAPEGTSDG